MEAKQSSNDPTPLLDALVTDDDLQRLEDRLGTFNVFEALGVVRAEVRHSNFLAWLLDPMESHGRGDLFLKAVLMDMLKNAPADLRPLSAAHLDGADLDSAEVRREWRRIDLLIICKSKKFAVIIENKVDSGEHSNQLERYEQIAREELPGLKPFFVFLTPDGEAASDKDWVAYSCAQLHGVLRRVRDHAEQSFGPDVKIFLDHYLSLVSNHMMNDEQIDELCRNIYKRHKQAMELIRDRAMGENPLLTKLHDLVAAQSDRWVITKRTKNEVRIVPKPWYDALPPAREIYKDHRSGWIACYLWCKDGYLEFSVWILKTSNPEVQERVAKRLLQSPDEFGFALKRRRQIVGTQALQLLGKAIDDWGEHGEPDEDSVIEKTKRELDALWSRVPAVTEAIRKVLATG